MRCDNVCGAFYHNITHDGGVVSCKLGCNKFIQNFNRLVGKKRRFFEDIAEEINAGLIVGSEMEI